MAETFVTQIRTELGAAITKQEAGFVSDAYLHYMGCIQLVSQHLVAASRGRGHAFTSGHEVELLLRMRQCLEMCERLQSDLPATTSRHKIISHTQAKTTAAPAPSPSPPPPPPPQAAVTKPNASVAIAATTNTTAADAAANAGLMMTMAQRAEKANQQLAQSFATRIARAGSASQRSSLHLALLRRCAENKAIAKTRQAEMETLVAAHRAKLIKMQREQAERQRRQKQQQQQQQQQQQHKQTKTKPKRQQEQQQQQQRTNDYRAAPGTAKEEAVESEEMGAAGLSSSARAYDAIERSVSARTLAALRHNATDMASLCTHVRTVTLDDATHPLAVKTTHARARLLTQYTLSPPLLRQAQTQILQQASAMSQADNVAADSLLFRQQRQQQQQQQQQQQETKKQPPQARFDDLVRNLLALCSSTCSDVTTVYGEVWGDQEEVDADTLVREAVEPAIFDADIWQCYIACARACPTTRERLDKMRQRMLNYKGLGSEGSCTAGLAEKFFLRPADGDEINGDGSDSNKSGDGGAAGNQSDVGEGHQAIPYASAISYMQALGREYTPTGKISSAIAASKAIVSCIDDFYHDDKPDAHLVGCDDLILLLTHCVLSAGREDILLDVAFMGAFIPESRLLGEEGYVLATLQTAVEFLLQGDDETPPS